MSRGTPFRFARFGKGLNTTVGPYSLREGYADDPQGLGSEARDLLNVVSSRHGNISRRDGCVDLKTLTPSTTLITSGSVIGQDAGSFVVASTSAGSLVAFDPNTPTAVTTLVSSGLSTSAPWKFLRLPVVSAKGPAYGMNGTDTPRWTTGAGSGATQTNTWTATSGTVPNGKMMVYWENSVFVSGVAANPERVYWSYPGDPLNWPSENVVGFEPNDGSPVTAIASLGPNLLVFKERGIWAVYDSETGANRKVADGVGTLSPDSVVSTEQGCFFFDPQQGFMVTDGQTVKVVSKQLDKTLSELSNAARSTVSAAYYEGHYYASVELVDGRALFDFDTQLDSWWKHSPKVSQLLLWDRGSGVELVGVNSTKGQLLVMFKSGESKDDGVTYESYWMGPYHMFGAPHLRKRCRQIHFDGRGTVDVYVGVDYSLTKGDFQQTNPFSGSGADDVFGGSGSFGGEGYFGQQVTIGEDVVYTPGIGRSFSVSLYSASSQYWELDAYTMLMTQRKNN